jgi:hypothetical protein
MEEACSFEMSVFAYKTTLYYSPDQNLYASSSRSLIYFIIILHSGVRLSPLGTAATAGLLYQPQMIDYGDCGTTGGLKFGRGKRSIRKKPAPAPPCSPQIPHDLTPRWEASDQPPELWRGQV